MSPSLDELVKQGEGDQDAVDLGDGIFMSRNIANSYLVTTADGDVMINTGTDFEAPAIKARFSRVSPGPPRVIFHEEASTDSTVIEIRCTTKIGILHRIAKALAEVGLDIRHATVQTIGLEVVDTFYVRNWSGDRIDDPLHRAEIERAVLDAVS